MSEEQEQQTPSVLEVAAQKTNKTKTEIEERETFYLDGESLTDIQLVQLGNTNKKIGLSKEAWKKVETGRAVVDKIVAEGRVVYGINTGFGKFANVVIDNDRLHALQVNLIRSHAAGVGRPLSIERTRRLMALRINVLAKGRSGISVETLQQMIDAWNADCMPLVPQKGTLGASGDLAPLAHLALGLIGEGKMWDKEKGQWEEARLILQRHSLLPLHLKAKEGLSLINGTQLISTIGAECCIRALACARAADVIGALSVEVLRGTPRAFHPSVHKERPHSGQIRTAARLRALLDSDQYPSKIRESHKDCKAVQDAYTLRCIPQIHGVVWDTIKFVRSVMQVEFNSATDNPMVFAESQDIISAGNFHGEYPAKMLDYLAIGVHELAQVSERRTDRLVTSSTSGLPDFLVREGGLNSGFMIAHCTAAALTSENKTLVHPASADTLPTSAGQEDHVSMGGWAAFKCLNVIRNVESVLAIELLASCQALDLLHDKGLTSTEPLEAIHKLVRTVVKPWDEDRYMQPDMEAATKLIRDRKIWDTVLPFFKKIGLSYLSE